MENDYRKELGALTDDQLRSWARLQRDSWDDLSRYVISCYRIYREARGGNLPEGLTGKQAEFLLRDYRFVLSQARVAARYWRRKIRAIEEELLARGIGAAVLQGHAIPFLDLSARVSIRESGCPSSN